jgi:hypothetical protein
MTEIQNSGVAITLRLNNHHFKYTNSTSISTVVKPTIIFDHMYHHVEDFLGCNIRSIMHVYQSLFSKTFAALMSIFFIFFLTHSLHMPRYKRGTICTVRETSNVVSSGFNRLEIAQRSSNHGSP